MKNLIKKTFSNEDLAAITAEIGKSAKVTTADIRVSVRQKRRWQEKKISVEEVARREYQLLGMDKTKEQFGVLLFILLEDKEFFILADDVTYKKIGEEFWTRATGEISAQFVKKNFRQGIIQCVQMAGEELSKSLPRK